MARLGGEVESCVRAEVELGCDVVGEGGANLRRKIAKVVLSAFEFDAGTEWRFGMLPKGYAFVLRLAGIGSPDRVHHVLSVVHRTKVRATIVEAIAIPMMDLDSPVQPFSAENNHAMHINRQAACMCFRVTRIS